MIGVVCKHPAYGAADNIVRAFRSQNIDAKLLYLVDPYKRITEKDKKEFAIRLGKGNIHFWLKELLTKKENRMFLCSTTIIQTLFKKFNPKILKRYLLNSINTTPIFITGTSYIRKLKYFNRFMNNFKIWPRFFIYEN